MARKTQAGGIEGLVLSGGRGLRAGGLDKGLLRYAGQPCVLHALRCLQPECERVLVSANRNLERYRELVNEDVICDRRGEFQGPLAGLEAAAGKLRGELLLVLPCDLPALAPSVPAQLLQALKDDVSADAVYARAGERDHYLCAALRTSCLGSLEGYLERGGRSVRGWYAQMQVNTLGFSGDVAAGFRNFNDARDFDENTGG